mgnify:FL=1
MNNTENNSNIELPLHIPEHDHKLERSSKDNIDINKDNIDINSDSNKSNENIESNKNNKGNYYLNQLKLYNQTLLDIYSNLSLSIKVFLYAFIGYTLLTHYASNPYLLFHRVYEVFAIFYTLYTIYHLYVYKLDTYNIGDHYDFLFPNNPYQGTRIRLLHYPFDQKYIYPKVKFLYKYVLMRHAYVTRRGFFILNIIHGILAGFCLLPVFKLTIGVDPEVYNQTLLPSLLPNLFMSINLDYFRAVQGSTLHFSLGCLIFYTFILFIHTFNRVNREDDSTYQNLDAVREGTRINVKDFSEEELDDLRSKVANVTLGEVEFSLSGLNVYGVEYGSNVYGVEYGSNDDGDYEANNDDNATTTNKPNKPNKEKTNVYKGE